jgi:copper chaperone CopZ
MSVTHDYKVTGLDCEHCVRAITEELNKLPAVSAVAIQLDPSSDSTVTIMSSAPLAVDDLAAALNAAGEYALVSL